MRMFRWLCTMLLVLCLSVPGVLAEDVLYKEPTVLINAVVSGELGETIVLPLSAERNGTWQWVAVPTHNALGSMKLTYEPSPLGFLQLARTFDAFTSPGEPPAISLDSVDFTQSEAMPYAYRVLDRMTGEVLRTGWLTVSYSVRPANLPDVPVPPTPTEPPAPTPEPPPQPTAVPPPAPTWTPEPQPTYVPMPTMLPQQTGYGVITYPTRLREQPWGAEQGSVQAGTVVHVEGQFQSQDGAMWHMIKLLNTGSTGYILSNYLRFMTQQEINDYFNPPTPLPTYRPVPTLRPNPTFSPALGYLRITRETTLRRSPGDSAGYLSTRYAGDVVYAMSGATDIYGGQWLYVQSGGLNGYVRAAHTVVMTAAEVAAYLESLRATPTPRPTALPTLDPTRQYAVVKMDNVNFRVSAGGAAIRRVNKGTVAQLLEDPTWLNGYAWYRVQIDKEIGYLRGDMIDIIQVGPTATPRPAALPTMPPLSLQDRIQASKDTARYLQYARNTDAVSYAVADFDSDRYVELLLVIPYTRIDGSNALRLDAFKLVDGRIQRVARREIVPVLTRNTTLSVDLVEQDGRTVVYVTQGSGTSAASAGGQGLTLVDTGWLSVGVRRGAGILQEVMRASANARGVVTYQDLSDLHD